MNTLRDYYERALQEFGTSDDGEQSLNALKGQESKGKVALVKNIYSQYPVYQVSIQQKTETKKKV